MTFLSIKKRASNHGRTLIIDLVIVFLSAVTMVCYIMYTFSPEVVQRFGTTHLYVTSIFVLAGIIRYLQIAVVENKTGNPTKILLHDRFIQICIMCWGCVFMVIIYA